MPFRIGLFIRFEMMEGDAAQIAPLRMPLPVYPADHTLARQLACQERQLESAPPQSLAPSGSAKNQEPKATNPLLRFLNVGQEIGYLTF